MSADTTKAMQEALQAAVSRMNNGPTESKTGAPSETIGLLMSIVPKLLQGSQSSEEMVEKLDALQKGELTSLSGQVEGLRKQFLRMLKCQEQLLVKVGAMQKEQAAVARAVLDLAHQMARITLIDDVPGGEDEYEREVPLADSYRDAASRTNGGRARPKGREKHFDRARP